MSREKGFIGFREETTLRIGNFPSLSGFHRKRHIILTSLLVSSSSASAISSLRASLGSYMATINLSTTWDTTPLDRAHLDMLAKHEVIHLLISRSMSCGKARYLTLDEMEEAEEELTNKLVNII